MPTKRIAKPKSNSNALITAAAFSGPIPHPSILVQYNQIAPNAADRIIGMAEKQSDHRQEIEKKVINSEIINSTLGLLCGFLIGLSAIVGGVLCIMNGHSTGGVMVSGGGISGLAGVFVYGSNNRKKERENRFKQINKK